MKKYFYDLKEEKLFLMAYSFWLVDAIIGITMWRSLPLINTMGDYLRKVGYCLLIVQFFSRKKYTRRDVVGIFMIILAGMLAYHSVYNRHIISAMILIYFSANVDYRKILKCTFLIQASFMTVTILASQLDVIEDVIWQQENGRIRQSLGYDYCGYPAHLLLFMTLIWFSIRKKICLFEVALFLGLNTAIYLATDSRADYYLSLVAMLGFWLIGRMRKYKAYPFIEFVIKFGCGILAVFSIGVHFFFDANNKIMASINFALSNRLFLGKQAIQQYGFSLFGRVIHWFGQGSVRKHPERVYNYVDCAFLKELLSFGIVFLIVLIVAYYIVGKRLAEEKNYVLGWAMIVSFLYAVINAHLCMVQYNVFILMLGGLFTTEQCTLTEEAATEKQGFFYQMQDWGDKLFTEKGKHVLRTALLLALLVIPTYLQRSGMEQMLSSASLYRWILCGVLFWLAALTYEGDCPENRKNMFLYVVSAFLILAMVSDFFVDKKFRYAAFALSVFGGMFVWAWRSMEHPKKLMQEFKIAYKLYFLLVLFGGIIGKRSVLGFCNQGMFLSGEETAVVMLIAIVVLLDDIQKQWTAVYHVGGILLSLYVLYTTGQKILLLTSIGIIMVYLAVKCYQRFGHKAEKKSDILLLGSVMLGCIALGGLFLWKLHPDDYFGIIKTYLKEINLLGHAYVPKFQKQRAWTVSSTVMNIYRYGILAGIAYFLIEISYFVVSCRHMLHTKSFIPIGLAIGGLVINETVVIQMPFIHVGWIILFWGLGYMLVERKNSTKGSQKDYA